MLKMKIINKLKYDYEENDEDVQNDKAEIQL